MNRVSQEESSKYFKQLHGMSRTENKVDAGDS